MHITFRYEQENRSGQLLGVKSPKDGNKCFLLVKDDKDGVLKTFDAAKAFHAQTVLSEAEQVPGVFASADAGAGVGADATQVAHLKSDLDFYRNLCELLVTRVQELTKR